ncbi:uncharacterized protein LOC125042161 [Penaeus chinensis]|uniref:uncharacterized protein LOC125042161 n=1 Tax=Penaeus chinensis TaxID=139456 RepID=UPI001FB85E19|nr:uncharacterized protein LOC125042161 [Penaeus chinensis]
MQLQYYSDQQGLIIVSDFDTYHLLVSLIFSLKTRTGMWRRSGPSASDAMVQETKKLFMEEQVIYKFECQPVVDTYNQKREAVKKEAQHVAGLCLFIDYRPIAAHKSSRPPW